MGKTYVGEIKKTEAEQSPTILGNADLMKGVSNNDIRDNKWTLQFGMGGGSAVLAAKGPTDEFTDYRTGLVNGDLVVMTDDEGYSEFRVTWTGTGNTGSVCTRGEARS